MNQAKSLNSTDFHGFLDRHGLSITIWRRPGDSVYTGKLVVLIIGAELEVRTRESNDELLRATGISPNEVVRSLIAQIWGKALIIEGIYGNFSFKTRVPRNLELSS